MLTQETLKELLHYDPDTGVFTWLSRNIEDFSEERFWKQWCVRYEGEIAGCLIKEQNYIIIGINGKIHRAHRLAWLYVTGEFPDDQIDHINHVRYDNRWCNLREATDVVNRKNQSRRKDNISGITGIHWDKSRVKWCAEITSNGVKHFLGRFECLSDAVEARKNAEREHGFHENHGGSHGC